MFPYFLPLATVSVLAIVSSGLITYEHQERRVLAGALLVLGSSIWLLMQALELTSASLPTKFFFYMIRYVGIVTVPVAWLILAMLISGYERHVTKRNVAALTVIPIVTLFLVSTNSYQLMFSNVTLNSANASLPLVVAFGPAYWVLVVGYSYVLMIVGFVMIARRLVSTRRPLRVLGVRILLVAMVPWVLNVAFVLDSNAFMNFEPSSLVISVAGAVLLSRIAKLPMLGVLPVAHEALLDSMSEAIFVLDKRNRIVDANPKARSLFGSTLPQTIGASIEKTWTEWPSVEKALNSGNGAAKEVTLGNESGGQICEVQSSRIKGLIGNESYQLIILRDITKRKQVENALQESERRLRLVTDHMLDMVIQTDLQGTFEYVSPSHRMLGYEPRDLVGTSIFELVHPDDVERSVNAFMDGVERRTPKRLELRYKNAEGHYVWIESVGNPIFDQNGQVSGAIIGSRDITERRRAEEALRDSQDRLRRITDNMLDIVVETDIQGICKYASPSNKAILGYDPKDLVGKSLFEFVHPEDLGAVTKLIDRAISSDKLWTGGKFECRYRHADGHYVWLEVLANIIRDHKGQMIGGVMGARDITTRKRMEEDLKRYSTQLEQLVAERTGALRESEKKYRQLIETAQEGLFTYGTTGVVTFVNPFLTVMLGYAPEEMIGKNLLTFVDDQTIDKVKAGMERRRLGVADTYEARLIRKDGSRILANVTVSPITEEGGKFAGGLALLSDITERKNLETQLVESQRLAAIGEAAAMVGHDLRNPLQGIAGATYLLREEPLETEERNEMLQIIEKSVAYSDGIVNDLLDYARPLQLALVESTPKRIVASALGAIQVPDKITINDRTEEEPVIAVDIDRMKRVFINLIENAVDAMPKGGTLTISSTQSDKFMQFRISDTGTGLSKEIMEAPWKPLQTKKAKGMGLGLSIVKRIIDAHEGEISIATKEEEGTTFTIRLPIKRSTT